MDASVSEQTKPCPSCGKPILAKALQCRHCRSWLHAGPAAPERPRLHAPSFEAGEYSNGQRALHLVVLSLLTFGIYEFYWFYRNWRDLRDHAGIDVDPAWRTFGLLVPFVNIFMVYHQLSVVRDVAEKAGEEVYYGPGILTVVFFTLAILSNLTMVWAISLLTVLPLLPVQATLNRYWQRSQPGLPIREEFDANEAFILFAGGIMTMMMIAASLSM